MNIEHISVSRMQTWQTCQQSYKFKYHLKVISGEPTPIYFTFGKMVHRIIEEYTRNRGQKNINDIRKAVEHGDLEIETGVKAPLLDIEHKRRLIKHLTSFMKLTDKIGTDGDVEWKFDLDLDPPHSRKITGFIDRLILKNGIVSIIDYKTSKVSPWRKDEKTIIKDLQLQAYCWIVWKKLGIEPKNIRAALYYLEDSKLVPACWSEGTLRTVPERMLKAFKDIELTNPDQVLGNVGRHCRFCDFRKICSFYSLT